MPKKKKIINSVADLYTSFISDTPRSKEDMQSAIRKAVYKGTTCGAWVAFNDAGVSVGSIVEGIDAETQVHTLTYPFNNVAFWAALDDVENEAQEIWDENNSEEEWTG